MLAVVSLKMYIYTLLYAFLHMVILYIYVHKTNMYKQAYECVNKGFDL